MYVLHIRGEWGYIYFGYNVIVCKFCGFFLKPLRNRKDDSCVSKYHLCCCVLIFVLVAILAVSIVFDMCVFFVFAGVLSINVVVYYILSIGDQ